MRQSLLMSRNIPLLCEEGNVLDMNNDGLCCGHRTARFLGRHGVGIHQCTDVGYFYTAQIGRSDVIYLHLSPIMIDIGLYCADDFLRFS